MGKDWAKGLTAATDARIARNGAARRGRRYKTKRHAARSLEWSLELAYALGLTATDGCLSRDRRHITFDSKDRDLVETYLRCVGRENTRVFPTRTRTGGRAYRAAFSDTSLYDWLFALDRWGRHDLCPEAPANAEALPGLLVRPTVDIFHIGQSKSYRVASRGTPHFVRAPRICRATGPQGSSRLLSAEIREERFARTAADPLSRSSVARAAAKAPQVDEVHRHAAVVEVQSLYVSR